MRHLIRGVGICQIVVGAFELLSGGMVLVAVAVGMAAEQVATGVEPVPGSDLQALPTLVVGGITTLLAIARIAVGIRILDVRGRTAAIVISTLGVLNLLNCSCLPLSLGALIFTLIVFLDADATQAFAARAQGTPAAELRARVPASLPPGATGTPSPRQVHDQSIADALVRCLPQTWDSATLHVAVPRDRTSDRVGLEIEPPVGAAGAPEPSRELIVAVQRVVGFTRMHRQDIDTMTYAVFRDVEGRWTHDVRTHYALG